MEIISTERYNYSLKETHISDIKSGDTILHNGHMKTVCKNNIKDDKFMGRSIFGDNYIGGRKAVQVVTFHTRQSDGTYKECKN